MTRLQVPHQRVPRRTKAKPANRDGLIVHRSDGPQTAGPGDGRARRRRRRRADDDGDERAVIAVVDRDDVGGAVGAAIVGVKRVGVGVPRGCPASGSKLPFLVTGSRRPSPSPAPGAGDLDTTDPCYHYATLSHGEEVEVESVAGARGRSAERAKGRDATRGHPAGTTGATSRSTSDRGRDGEAVTQA